MERWRIVQPTDARQMIGWFDASARPRSLAHTAWLLQRRVVLVLAHVVRIAERFFRRMVPLSVTRPIVKAEELLGMTNTDQITDEQVIATIHPRMTTGQLVPLKALSTTTAWSN